MKRSLREEMLTLGIMMTERLPVGIKRELRVDINHALYWHGMDLISAGISWGDKGQSEAERSKVRSQRT